MRRKSFSLVLLILIVIFILALVILSVYLINKPTNRKKRASDENSLDIQLTISSENDQDNNFNTVDNSFINSLDNIEPDNTNSQEENSQNTTSTVEGYTITLNNHTYRFDNHAQATASSDNLEIQINYPDSNYRIIYSTDSSTNFESLKTNPDLSNIIESKHNVSLVGNLKTGTVNGLNLIVGTVSDNGAPAYLIFTPLNDNEVACAKVYNTENTQDYVKDLSGPLNEISAIISSVT